MAIDTLLSDNINIKHLNTPDAFDSHRYRFNPERDVSEELWTDIENHSVYTSSPIYSLIHLMRFKVTYPERFKTFTTDKDLWEKVKDAQEMHRKIGRDILGMDRIVKILSSAKILFPERILELGINNLSFEDVKEKIIPNAQGVLGMKILFPERSLDPEKLAIFQHDKAEYLKSHEWPEYFDYFAVSRLLFPNSIPKRISSEAEEGIKTILNAFESHTMGSSDDISEFLFNVAIATADKAYMDKNGFIHLENNHYSLESIPLFPNARSSKTILTFLYKRYNK